MNTVRRYAVVIGDKNNWHESFDFTALNPPGTATVNIYNPVYMEWWMWLAAGLALVVAELATPGGFVIVFFGIGALSVGLLALLEIVTSPPIQFLLFSVISVASLAILRGRLQSRIKTPPSSNVDTLVGVVAINQERLSPGLIGRVEVRGTMWAARNTSDVTLDPGQRARVAAVDGLTLAVVPE